MYQYAHPTEYSHGLLTTPCGICPVIHACTEDGVISPRTCIYLPKWLEY
jgi:DNA-directed RNA polymerase III subunit RPC6